MPAIRIEREMAIRIHALQAEINLYVLHQENLAGRNMFG